MASWMAKTTYVDGKKVVSKKKENYHEYDVKEKIYQRADHNDKTSE